MASKSCGKNCSRNPPTWRSTTTRALGALYVLESCWLLFWSLFFLLLSSVIVSCWFVWWLIGWYCVVVVAVAVAVAVVVVVVVVVDVVLKGLDELDLLIINVFLINLISISLLLLFLLLLLLLVASREQANIIFIGVDRRHCWLYDSLAQDTNLAMCKKRVTFLVIQSQNWFGINSKCSMYGRFTYIWLIRIGKYPYMDGMGYVSHFTTSKQIVIWVAISVP